MKVETKTAPLEIGVEGMTCAACVRRVENGLRKLPQVVDAQSIWLPSEPASNSIICLLMKMRVP